MSSLELDNIINDAKNALKKDIVNETERFVDNNILHNGIFDFGGWHDACGTKIGDMVISAVKDAVDNNLDLYDCLDKLDTIHEKLKRAEKIIDKAKEELQ